MSLIHYLTRIHFAEHVLQDALGAELARLRAKRPLILIDADGRAEGGTAALDDALPCEKDAIWAEAPDLECAAVMARPEAARAAARSAGADAVLAFGGVAAQRAGRALAAATDRALPLIAVPTTTADIGLARGAAGPGKTALPAAILCDPTLTYRLGPQRTAAHGFDALTHCIEAFLAPGFNPPADGIALEGIYRVARYLEDALEGGERPQARREVMAGALNGALAGQKGFGGIEALASAIEAEAGAPLPHGRLHASVLPRMLRFNSPAIGDRLDRIARAMESPRGTDAITSLAALGARVGLPQSIGHLGLGAAALQRVAATAAADPATQTNPRHVTKEDYLGLLAEAI